MTAISFAQAARLSRLGRRARIAAIKVGGSSRNKSRYLIASAQVRERFKVHIVNITSRQQEFAGGGVEFLLGRHDHTAWPVDAHRARGSG